MVNTEALAKAVKESLKEEGIALNQKESRLVIDTVVAQILAGVIEDGHVRVTGLGDFTSKHVEASTKRNPQTGEPVEVEAHNRASVKLAKSFKESVR